MSNINKGEYCYVVNAGRNQVLEQNLGRFVVTRQFLLKGAPMYVDGRRFSASYDGWWVEGSGLYMQTHSGDLYGPLSGALFPAVNLRPIHDPGEDAADQVLRPLPADAKEVFKRTQEIYERRSTR